MSDYNSALPIRTEGDATEKVQVRILDKSVDANQLAVNADGSINITDNSGSLTVDAVNLDIRDLAFATDKVDVSGSTNVAVVDGGGSLTVDAVNLDIRDLAFATDKVDVSGSSVTVSATDLDIRDLAFATDKVDVSGSSNVAVVDGGGSLTVDAVNLDIRDLAFATDKVDVSGSSVSVSGSVTVSATDLDIRDLSHTQDSIKIGDGTDFLAVNTDGSINVAITSSVAGTAINNYNTSAALAAGASSNHDYTVTALKTLHLSQIWAAASGKLKIQVQVETGVASGTFNTIFVGFNSTANPIIDLDIDNPPSVAAGVRVRVIRTNLDNQAQDVYSTISGNEV